MIKENETREDRLERFAELSIKEKYELFLEFKDEVNISISRIKKVANIGGIRIEDYWKDKKELRNEAFLIFMKRMPVFKSKRSKVNARVFVKNNLYWGLFSYVCSRGINVRMDHNKISQLLKQQKKLKGEPTGLSGRDKGFSFEVIKDVNWEDSDGEENFFDKFIPSAEYEFGNGVDYEKLKESLSSLKSVEKAIISMYFFEGKNFREISESLKVNGTFVRRQRIHQIFQKTLDKLKTKLKI